MNDNEFTPQNAILVCDPQELSRNYEELLADTEEQKIVAAKWQRYGLLNGLQGEEYIECAVLFEVVARVISPNWPNNIIFNVNDKELDYVTFPVIRRIYVQGAMNGSNVGHIMNDLAAFWSACKRSALISIKATSISKYRNWEGEEYKLDNESELACLFSDMIIFKYGGKLREPSK